MPFDATDHALPATGGRLCLRTLSGGNALVGLLQLPPAFTPVEGVAYLLLLREGKVTVVPGALDEGLAAEHASMGVNDLLRARIWPQTTTPDARVVRFLAAFPETNHWTVFGPSVHPSPPGAANHRWLAIGAEGTVTPLAAPVDAAGMATGQILAQAAVWPDAQGALHTLSQLSTEWRGHFHRYHQLLVRSTQEPTLDATLETTIAQDPIFRQISLSRVDRAYCAYLAALDREGLLVVDGPRRAEAQTTRGQAAERLVRAALGEPASSDAPAAGPSRLRRSP